MATPPILRHYPEYRGHLPIEIRAAQEASASIAGRVASGPRAGRRVAKVGDAVDLEDLAVTAGPRCAAISGFSVHANVCVPAHDRMRLERLALRRALPGCHRPPLPIA